MNAASLHWNSNIEDCQCVFSFFYVFVITPFLWLPAGKFWIIWTSLEYIFLISFVNVSKYNTIWKHPTMAAAVWLWLKQICDHRTWMVVKARVVIVELFFVRKSLNILTVINKWTNKRKKSRICGYYKPLISPLSGFIQMVWKHWSGYLSLLCTHCGTYWTIHIHWSLSWPMRTTQQSVLV